MKVDLTIIYLAIVLLITPFSSSGQTLSATNTHDTMQTMSKVWSDLLKKHVVAINHGHSTSVDYIGMKAQHSELKSYLNSLSAVTPSAFAQWSTNQQLAFLLNAYNAWTVELIVTNITGEKPLKLKSIKALGGFFSSPWSKKFIPLLGEQRSLDDIEHKLIRGAVDDDGQAKYNDPRIHFAVNCASIGCPALREEAYMAMNLEAQLQAQTVRFLSDISRNRIVNKTVQISSIFKWYREDFEQGYRGTYSVAEFLLLYPEAFQLVPAQQQALKNNEMNIKYLDYNWDLNAR